LYPTPSKREPLKSARIISSILERRWWMTGDYAPGGPKKYQKSKQLINFHRTEVL
jgi:hypothetical protein